MSAREDRSRADETVLRQGQTHMTRAFLLAIAAVAVLGPSGCKIVFDADVDETVIPDGPDGDKARNAQRIEDTFEPELLPLIREKALPVATLTDLIATDLNAAGVAHANRGSGLGAAWNFPVSGEGVVTEAKLDTRARAVSVDIDGDGNADVTLQLGPVIRGTALRDSAPFYQFDDFRDQIEFAKLSRALNNLLTEMIAVPEGDLVGDTVAFVGIVPLKSAKDKMVVTPIEVRFQP